MSGNPILLDKSYQQGELCEDTWITLLDININSLRHPASVKNQIDFLMKVQFIDTEINIRQPFPSLNNHSL